MDSAEFFSRFADGQEIGRDITDTHLSVFYDDGSDVGLWRAERSTTVGAGTVLAPHDAEMARYWFSRPALQARKGADRELDSRSPERQWACSITGTTGERRR